MDKKTVGIIGAGAIGLCLAEYAEKHLGMHIKELVIFDSDMEKMKTLAGRLKNVVSAPSVKNLVERSDLVIESASAGVVPDVFENVLREGKDLMIMSIGGLLGNEEYLDKARRKGINVILPSGAIAAIDGLKSFKAGGLEKVTLTTRKAPRSIKGAPYLVKNNINVDAFTEETVVFEGSAIDAVKGFPKNVNVSALLSIAGMGAEKTKVRIIVSPEYTKNIHEIVMQGNAGKITLRAENVPSPDNPKTSYLAALAACAALAGYFDTVRIGT